MVIVTNMEIFDIYFIRSVRYSLLKLRIKYIAYKLRFLKVVFPILLSKTHLGSPLSAKLHDFTEEILMLQRLWWVWFYEFCKPNR